MIDNAAGAHIRQMGMFDLLLSWATIVSHWCITITIALIRLPGMRSIRPITITRVFGINCVLVQVNMEHTHIICAPMLTPE
jgi:hypothetical protein